jgi:hypothetical protein
MLRLGTLPRRDQGMRPLLRRDNRRRTTRQDSRELRNSIHLMGLTGTMDIPRNISLTGIRPIPWNTSLTGTTRILRNTSLTRWRV